MAETAPNIVVIMADQLAPQFTGAYGHPVVQTPHMSALAARGMRFDAAYCNAPLCAPARFSFMAGQLPTRIRAYDNASEFPASVPTFAHYLRLMGYRTSLAGKMHFVGPDQLHGFDDRVTTDVYPSDFAWIPDWENAGERIGKWYHNMESVQEAGTGTGTFQLDYDDEVAFFARRRIFDYARDKQQPFCLVASFIHPHDPYVARPEWWNLYEEAEIDLPRHGPGDVASDPLSARVRDGIEASTVEVSDDEIRNARRAYYANTSFVDAKIGKLVQALDEAEMLDNTIIIVTGDHGDMLGERGLWYKMTWFDHSVRVPLIIAGPGIAQGTTDTPCSLIDLMPTMLDIAGQSGAPAPELSRPANGRSLLPVAWGDKDGAGEAIGEYCAEMTAHPVFMIRRGRFKYVHCDSDPAQFYDLAADPDEMTNLATDPAHGETSAAFAAEVAARWNSAELRRDVIASQWERRVVYQAMQTGAPVHWDYNPPRLASEEYVRNHMDWTVAAERMRFPPLKR